MNGIRRFLAQPISFAGLCLVAVAVPPAAAAPGATPAPPAVTAQAPPPTPAPENASTTSTTAPDGNPDIIGATSPALQEINDAEANAKSNPPAGFGFGVVPRDAANVTGAPDPGKFLDPTLNESACTWTREVRSTDANHDGRPEFVEVKMLGTCPETANGTGVAGATVARDVRAWDNDSSGPFHAVAVRQGLGACAGPRNGTYEYDAADGGTMHGPDAEG